MSLPPMLEGLLEQLASEDWEAQNEAILYVSLLLEKHSTLADSQAFYEDMLPEPLLTLTLGEGQQREVVTRLGALVVAGKLTPNILMAVLGTGAEPPALSALANLLGGQGHSPDEETTWEALRSVERLLTPEGGKLPAEATALIEGKELPSALTRLADAGSPRVQKLAGHILEKIRTYGH